MSAAAALPATRFPQLLRRPDGVSGRRIAMAGFALLLLIAAASPGASSPGTGR